MAVGQLSDAAPRIYKAVPRASQSQNQKEISVASCETRRIAIKSMEFPVSLIALVAWLGAGAAGQPYQHRHHAAAPIGHDGRVVDTPEVAQAKAAHLAAFSQLAQHPPGHYHAAAAAPAPAYGAHYSNPGFFTSRIQHGHYGYRGPPAPLAHDGRVLDTPEVAQAKAAHFAALNQASTRHYEAPVPAPAAYNEDYDTGAYRGDDDDGSGSGEGHYEAHASTPYQGPPAPLAQDGRVVDTPEVAHAKAAHLAAFQRAAHHQPPARQHYPPQPYYDY